jgi:hypothetical protein
MLKIIILIHVLNCKLNLTLLSRNILQRKQEV